MIPVAQIKNSGFVVELTGKERLDKIKALSKRAKKIYSGKLKWPGVMVFRDGLDWVWIIRFPEEEIKNGSGPRRMMDQFLESVSNT